MQLHLLSWPEVEAYLVKPLQHAELMTAINLAIHRGPVASKPM